MKLTDSGHGKTHFMVLSCLESMSHFVLVWLGFGQNRQLKDAFHLFDLTQHLEIWITTYVMQWCTTWLCSSLTMCAFFSMCLLSVLLHPTEPEMTKIPLVRIVQSLLELVAMVSNPPYFQLQIRKDYLQRFVAVVFCFLRLSDAKQSTYTIIQIYTT